jgi:hypothetical protein
VALKYFFTVLSIFLCVNLLHSQTDSSRKDTAVATVTPIVKPTPAKPKVIDTVQPTIRVDSLKLLDSLQLAYKDSLQKDSIAKTIVIQKPKLPTNDTSTYAAIMYHQYIPYNVAPVFRVTQYRNEESTDYLFYALLGILTIVAFIRVTFPKYFQSLFQLFLQTSFRQKQTKEQLLQDNLASLLMNLVFILSVGMFITLLASRYKWVHIDFWPTYLYCCSLLLIIYAVKYLFLRFSGWVFNVKPAADTYLFIVFLVNKVLGIISLPFVFILAFSVPKIVTVSLTVITIISIILLAYRYVASLGTIRTSLKVNALHFFLYLCAVEVLPLLIMYKAFFNFIND